MLLYTKCFVQQETKFKDRLTKSKSNFFCTNIEENKNNAKKLWSHLKSLGYSNKSKKSSNIILKVDGEVCFDPLKVATHINTFLVTVANKLTSSLPIVTSLFGVDSDNLKYYYEVKGVQKGSLKLQPVTNEFIFKELGQLNQNKSTGLDGISPRFLKDGAEILKVPIGHIVNLSLNTNIFPDDMKQAKITPLHKNKIQSGSREL